MDFSNVCTVPATSRYDLDRLNIDTIDEKIRQFTQSMLSQKQVVFDWGAHMLYSCRIPFSINYERNKITPIEANDWATCDPADLHRALIHIFEGEVGPTSKDTIVRIENSGIRVFLSGSRKYLPDDPQRYMEELRQSLRP